MSQFNRLKEYGGKDAKRYGRVPMLRRKLTPQNMTKEEVAKLRDEWNKVHTIAFRVPSRLVRTSPWWRFWNVDYEAVEQ